MDRRVSAPERLLRAAAAAASRPQAPLYSPAARAALVAIVGLFALIAFTLLSGLRGNAAAIGPALAIVPAALCVVAGAGLLALALREAVPGRAASSAALVSAFVAGFTLLGLFSLWLDRAAGEPGGGFGPLGCYRAGLTIALPATLLFVWLLLRAFPMRPIVTGALGALGAGLFADATLHLICPATNLKHTLFIHGGAVATIALAGAVAGWVRSMVRSSRGL